MTKTFTVTRHEIMYAGRVFTAVRDEVEFRKGVASIREVVEHGGGAVAVPVFPGGDVLLIRQFRYPVRREILELPAGKLDRGEDPVECARRELEEEAGWRAASMEHLSSMMTTPGFCSEILHLYLATGLTPCERNLEEGEESIVPIRIPLREALEMTARGDISDGKTIAGLFLAAMRLGCVRIQSVVPEGIRPFDHSNDRVSP
ncbi:MAG: NUDIX hydrolase [Bacteroidota bacterium]|nr:NUDIX hydrolase [Bacteroidota bacterium]